MANGFNIEHQEQMGWCWAAVGVTVSKFFEGPAKYKQCQLVDMILGTHDSCDKRPPTASEGESLKQVLQYIGALSPVAAETPLKFQDLKDQIDKGLPVCARIQWAGGEGHFIILYGWGVSESGEEWIDIADPLYGFATVPYQHFETVYRNSGTWTDTYFVQKPVIAPGVGGTNGK